MKITQVMIEKSYLAAKDVYDKSIQKSVAIDILANQFEMNENSATDFINNFHHMLNGEEYKRTNNLKTTDYYLRNIFRDCGEESYTKALIAVKKHIQYYEKLRGTRLKGLRSVYDKHKTILNTAHIPRLVRNIYEQPSLFEVRENAQRFNVLNENSKCYTMDRFGSFSHWYYFPDLSIFAPSKFIGYKNTSNENYSKLGSGGTTEKNLQKWFVGLEKNSALAVELRAKLNEYVSSLGKSISLRKSGAIHVLKHYYVPSGLDKKDAKNLAIKNMKRNAKNACNQSGRTSSITYKQKKMGL